ncbi:MAG: helix-turn-helix transcriptional regulator [Myxococcota bacterium]
MDTDWEKVGETIRVRRKAAKLSQEKLAARAGISRVSLTRIENATQTPETDTLRKIATALEMGLDELTGGTVTKVTGREVLEILLDSPWKDAIQITDEERLWLTSLPSTTWYNVRPSAEIIADFLRTRRRLSEG